MLGKKGFFNNDADVAGVMSMFDITRAGTYVGTDLVRRNYFSPILDSIVAKDKILGNIAASLDVGLERVSDASLMWKEKIISRMIRKALLVAILFAKVSNIDPTGEISSMYGVRYTNVRKNDIETILEALSRMRARNEMDVVSPFGPVFKTSLEGLISVMMHWIDSQFKRSSGIDIREELIKVKI